MTHQITDILLHILDETKNRISEGLEQCLVFDLDSTLFNVTPRNQAILDEFIVSEHLEDQVELRRSFQAVKIQVNDHGLGMALRRSGIEVPNETLKMKLIHFWKEKFFSDDYLAHDCPFEGASEYIRELFEMGARIYYLTGRDRIRMGVGTPRELKRWGFPLDDQRAMLIMKPQQGQDDSEFKVGELKKLQARWLFENEPKIIQHVELEIPQLKIVFFDSSHSGKAEPKSEWMRIQHFKRKT